MTDENDFPLPPTLFPMNIRRPRGGRSRPRGRPRGRPPLNRDIGPPPLQVVLRGRGVRSRRSRGGIRGISRGIKRGRGRGRGPGRPLTRGTGRVGRPPLSLRPMGRGMIHSIRRGNLNIISSLERKKHKEKAQRIKNLLHNRNGETTNKQSNHEEGDTLTPNDFPRNSFMERTHKIVEVKNYWTPSSSIKSVLDQVKITDVTTPEATITIREATTEDGFFKNRDESIGSPSSKDSE